MSKEKRKKKNKLILFFFALFLLPKLIHSQLEADNWMFGRDYYVNFNHATVPDTVRYPPLSGILYGYGTTSYSDKNGNLLFYGGGGQLYDKNFQGFPSLDIFQGTPLYSTAGNLQATQPILGIPYPGHDSLYIIFHIRCDFNNQYRTQLYYSVVNMRLRNGLGEVVPSQKNVSLLNGVDVGFKLTAVTHCNKRDIWVIGHLLESDQYFSILVTDNGITPTPLNFSGNFIPRVYPNNSLHSNNVGCAKISASGNRLAAAFKGMNFIELFDFNTQTGLASNLKTITAMPPPQDTAFIPFYFSHYGPLGVEFSPSGNRLYVTSSYDLKYNTSYVRGVFVYQFDASLPLQSLVQASKYRVDSMGYELNGAIQLGNNGRVYVNISDNLCEISMPENLGVACNYSRYTVWSGQFSPNGNLPAFLQSYFRYPVIATGNCQFQNISFSIQNLSGVNAILWDFGDPASGSNNTSTSFTPTHIYSQQGAFEVKAILYNSTGCGADTVRKIVHAGPFQVYLGNDTTICQGDTLTLRMNLPNAGNLWSDGSRDTAIKVTQSGTYWVRTNIGECFASDTINVTVRPLPAFTLGNDTIICSNQLINLSASPDPPGVSYIWSTGATASSITTVSDGLYWLKVRENGYGCSFSDSIIIQFRTLPEYSLGPDTAICEKDTITLNATVAAASGYSWNTGASVPAIDVYQAGIYWADVSKDGCVYRDSIDLIVKPLPVVNLGDDTTLCEDQTLLLDAQNPGSAYLWQNNSTDETYSVTKNGTYFVKVTTNGCAASDTTQIDYLLRPRFTLGPDKRICTGQEIVLNPGLNNVSYVWQNGSTSPVLTVNDIGLYYVNAINRCGATRDSILITKGICDLYVPSGFTPNNDGKNDLFKAVGNPTLKEFRLTVYNRWGEIIFDTKDKNYGWDGRYKNIFQPNDTYVWVIKYWKSDELKPQMLKGTVNLIR